MWVGNKSGASGTNWKYLRPLQMICHWCHRNQNKQSAESLWITAQLEKADPTKKKISHNNTTTLPQHYHNNTTIITITSTMRCHNNYNHNLNWKNPTKKKISHTADSHLTIIIPSSKRGLEIYCGVQYKMFVKTRKIIWLREFSLLYTVRQSKISGLL